MGLPSVLAIRDLQRRLRRALRGRMVGENDLVKILQLDPLAVLRGLRVANAPVFGSGIGPPTVRRLIQTLGPALSGRLLDTEPVSIAGTARIRRLWLHAIATAHAAYDLAAQDDILEPDAAYLLGLLHDLPEWLELLDQQFQKSASGIEAGAWIDHWHLPGGLTALVRGLRGPLPSTATGPLANAGNLVRAAELLANLADFTHTDTDENPDTSRILAAAERADLVAAQRLRRKVEAALRTYGLDPTLPDADLEGDDASLPFAGKRRGNLDEVVLSILGCTRSESYRGIVTALTAASVRYGSYDCAFYGKWNQIEKTMILRSKADSSARRMRATKLLATPDEAAALQAALREERPAHLEVQFGRREGILAALSADEVLAVPINLAFATPGFLLLNRSLSLTSIDPERDMPMAMTLGMTGSLLNENLLLRRRRQRAQKFALTDSLTRLFNRRMGLLALQQEIARAERTTRSLTVLMCDLDHFKQLNDSLGHLQGDVALRLTADVLQQTLRKSDTICRYGGEEFLVVLPDTTPDDATVLATRLFTAVHARGLDVGLPITISVGLTAYRPGDTVEAVLQRADRALYASKGSGRNRFSADVEGFDEAETPLPARP